MERGINTGMRYIQALVGSMKTLTLNKRLINFNIFVGALVLLILFQSFLLSKGTETGATDVLMMKGSTYLSHYDAFFRDHKPETVIKKPLQERCNLFFNKLSSNNPNWKLDDFSTEGYVDYVESFEVYLEDYKKKHSDEEINDKRREELEHAYNKEVKDSDKVNSKVIDHISILRIFNKCFIENEKKPGAALEQLKSYWKDDAAQRGTQDVCFDTEARIFPWLSPILPSYKRWDGSVSTGIPDLNVPEDYERSEPFKYSNVAAADIEKRSAKRETERENCFLKSVRNSINGKGYVVSASDGQVDELKRLALLFRVLGNKLPIQIVHKGDLSQKNQDALIKIFRDKVDIDKLQDLFEEFDIENSSAFSFPPQEVWFVDVQHSVKQEFLPHFAKFANKLLAYLFNSFEDMILIDTDTVPFVQLDKTIFSFPEYQSKGAYFFQDRQLKGQNTEAKIKFYKQLLPSKLDQYIFQIPTATDFTLKNRFFGDLRNHFMESGVVAINRKRHFAGMLTAVQLDFWFAINKKMIHGDKELFWLGLSIAGDEDYFFNDIAAASMGELTPQENKRLPNSNTKELCSNHPGHLDGHDERTLLWINAGMTYCKNLDILEYDLKNPLYKDRYNIESLRKLFKSATKIRAAIVPPPQEITAKNTNGNPENGWSNQYQYCKSYTWCAYETIGSGSEPEHKGLYVEFKEREFKWFDFIGDLWMDGLPASSYVST